nr:Cys-rich peptide radical SAM maturase CcpM [Maliibacterium massiliense]
MNEVIFKAFRTRRSGYVYDRHSNTVFAVPDGQYDEFKRVESGELPPEESPVVRHYQQFGLLQPNVVRRIENPSTNILEHLADRRLSQLILQVTQQCNLRCAYCAFSGWYEGRQHANKWMAWETAKKAMDFYLDHIEEQENIRVGFYGGEPLLAFDLIKKCVDYIERHVEGREISFNLTTNGTLLTQEVEDYFAAHKIDILISLDGAKEEHDANRKYSDGRGSFDTIMENVRRIKRDYPEYGRTIGFNTVINPKSDLGCVEEFFDADSVLADNYMMFSDVEPTNLKEELQYSARFYEIRRYEYLKLLFMLAGKIDRKAVSRLVMQSRSRYERTYEMLSQRMPLQESAHPGGPCMVGAQRLFVNVDGRFFPCEKVNEQQDFFCIGDVEAGFNLDKMKALINIGQCTADACASCWNLRGCSICAASVELGDACAVCAENKAARCRQQQQNVMSNLYETCVLREFGYDLLERGGEPL